MNRSYQQGQRDSFAKFAVDAETINSLERIYGPNASAMLRKLVDLEATKSPQPPRGPVLGAGRPFAYDTHDTIVGAPPFGPTRVTQPPSGVGTTSPSAITPGVAVGSGAKTTPGFRLPNRR